MLIKFEEEEEISYPYKPITITYKKNQYLIVPDFFKKISKVTFEGKEYSPSIVPEWLPFSIILLNDRNTSDYEKYLKVMTQKTRLKIGSFKKKIRNYIMVYHKIIPECPYSPRFYMYSFDIRIKDLNADFRDIVIKDRLNKIFGIYYYHEVIEDRYRFHFIPISLIISIIEGGNLKVISLPFKREPILKIGKNLVSEGKIFNNNLRMKVPVDINLMIEGKLGDEEVVSYKSSLEKYNYYEIVSVNVRNEEFIFKKGLQDKFSSMTGNKKLYDNYLKLLNF